MEGLREKRNIVWSFKQYALVTVQRTRIPSAPHKPVSVQFSSVTQSCLCDPVGQAPLSMEILQARILEWVAMPSSRGSS